MIDTDKEMNDKELIEDLRRRLNKAEGALNIALEHLGWQGADHDKYCADNYDCNAYGDKLLKCKCGCRATNTHGDYITWCYGDELPLCDDCRSEEE